MQKFRIRLVLPEIPKNSILPIKVQLPDGPITSNFLETNPNNLLIKSLELTKREKAESKYQKYMKKLMFRLSTKRVSAIETPHYREPDMEWIRAGVIENDSTQDNTDNNNKDIYEDGEFQIIRKEPVKVEVKKEILPMRAKLRKRKIKLTLRRKQSLNVLPSYSKNNQNLQ